MSFQVEASRRDGTTVLSVRGELDIATAPQVSAAIDGAAGPLVIDLTETTFLDSTGLRTLTGLSRQQGGGDVALVCPSSNRAVLLVLELAGFDTVLPRHETLAEAGVTDPPAG